MIRTQLALVVMLAASPGSALGQSLDYTRSRALVDSVRLHVTQLARWVESVRPMDLNLAYEEGKNIEFWLELGQEDAAQIDAAGAEFRARPSLSKLVDLVLEVRRFNQAMMALGMALADCHSCDAQSKERSGSWASAGHDPIRDLNMSASRLDTEMRSLIVYAETLIDSRGQSK